MHSTNSRTLRVTIYSVGFLAMMVTLSAIWYISDRTGTIRLETVVLSKMLDRVQDLMNNTVDDESAIRAYMLTRDKRVLQPYIDNNDDVLDDIDVLDKMKLDAQFDPLVKALMESTKARIARFRSSLKVIEDNGFDAANQIFAKGVGRAQGDDMRAKSHYIQTEQRIVIDKNDLTMRKLFQIRTYLFMLCCAIAGAMMAFFTYFYKRPTSEEIADLQILRRQRDSLKNDIATMDYISSS